MLYIPRYLSLLASLVMAFALPHTSIATSWFVSPSLVQVYPANDSIQVDSLQPISLKFDEGLDGATLSAGIVVTGSFQGGIAGTFSQPTADSVVFTPSAPYLPNEWVEVSISTSLLSDGGDPANPAASKFRVRASLGGSFSVTFSGQPLSYSSVSTTGDIVAGDIDGDGDLDLIGGLQSEGVIVAYENLGGNQYDAVVTLISGVSPADIELGDFDRDGDVDMAVVDPTLGLIRYSNDGTGAFSQISNDDLNDNAIALFVADFNNNQSLDFLIADATLNNLTLFDYGLNKFYLNATTDKDVINDVEGADMDGDGDLDIVTTQLSGANQGINLLSSVIQSNGDLSLTNTNLLSGFFLDILLEDLDQDGDVDILYTKQATDEVGILENDGSANFSNRIVMSGDNFNYLAVGDINGDGLSDIVATTVVSSGNATLRYGLNNGSNQGWSLATISGQSYGSTELKQVSLADTDGDGDLDILTHESDPNSVDDLFYVLENPLIDLNAAPSIVTPIDDIVVSEDTPVDAIPLTGVFADADGDALSYSVATSESQVQVSIAEDSVMTTVPADYFGVATITVTATDGVDSTSDAYVLTIEAVNDPPAFTLSSDTVSLTEDFGGSFGVAVTSNHPDNESDTIVYSLSPEITFVQVFFDSTSGNITFIAEPDSSGSAMLLVTASDGAFSETKSLILSITPQEDAPVPTGALANVALAEDMDSIVSLEEAFIEPDGDSLTYGATLLSGDTILSVSVVGDSLFLSPLTNRFGAATVKISATDPQGNVGLDTLDVTVAPVNDAPSFTLSGDLVLPKNFSTTETITASQDQIPFGEENQTVTYSISPANVSFAHVNLDGNTGEVTITAVTDRSGTQEFIVSADDGQGTNNTATQTFTLQVLDNLPPQVTGTLRDTTILEDAGEVILLSLDTLFTDAEGDSIHYTIEDDFNDSVTVALNGLVISATPVANYYGAGSVILRATSNGITTETSFLLTIQAINDAPFAVAVPSDTTILEDELFSFSLEAFAFQDVESDAITVEYIYDTTWLSLTNTTVSGTPTNEIVGTSSVYAIATDNQGAKDSVGFSITIQNTNDAPTGIELSATAVDEEMEAGLVVGTLTTLDPDVNDTHSYSVAGNAAFTAAGDQLVTTEVLDFETTTSYTLTITATDAEGSSITDTFTVTVNDLDEAVLGLADEALIESIVLYPNPAQDYLSVQFPMGEYTLCVVSLTGERLYQRPFIGSDISLPLESLSPGMYLLQVRSEYAQATLPFFRE